jgi:hypothetical protein
MTKENKTNSWIGFAVILILWFIIHNVRIGLEETMKNPNPPAQYNQTNNTKVEQSRYNNVAPSEYYKEMKSDNMEYADIAWHAKKTYGWNCDEVTNLGDKVYTNGNEIGDSYLKSQMVGYYQVATCSSGTKLRVYPRKDTYPMITNINGGWE